MCTVPRCPEQRRDEGGTGRGVPHADSDSYGRDSWSSAVGTSFPGSPLDPNRVMSLIPTPQVEKHGAGKTLRPLRVRGGRVFLKIKGV